MSALPPKAEFRRLALRTRAGFVIGGGGLGAAGNWVRKEGLGPPQTLFEVRPMFDLPAQLA